MSERKPVFNPQTVTSKKKAKKGQLKEKRLSLFQRKKEQDPNTRTIRFAPRTAQSIVSTLFFGLFLVMCVVVLMTFGRVDTLSRLAMSKQVNKEELVENVNQSLEDTEQLKYEGMKLADRLFTISHKDEGKEYWEEQVNPYLAKGLNASNLGFTETTVDRIARIVRFIKMKTINEKKAMYRLYYDVRFTEGKQWQQVQLILPVSYEGQEMKLIDLPTVTNLATSEEKNKSVYREDQFTPKGSSDLEEEEKNKITEFTQRFFELYVINDEKLALITNVKGLDKATLMNVEPKKVLRLKNGHYFVQGSYQFAYEEESPFTSNFSLEIKANKENYFVTKMNGE